MTLKTDNTNTFLKHTISVSFHNQAIWLHQSPYTRQTNSTHTTSWRHMKFLFLITG